MTRWGLFPSYQEKTQAGLTILDQQGRPLHAVRYPERVYERFQAIPPLLVATLLFVENRELLDARRPYKNPAIDWGRLAKAMGLKTVGFVGHEGREIGASTLATQIEKFRHSPDGRTQSSREKLRQMLSASLRAYRGGPDTLAARRQIVVEYLDSVPLAAVPGYGEVHGIGDGLWAWYGVDFAEANRVLTAPVPVAERERALVYKRMLSLVLSVRRPYHYLVEDRDALEDLTDSYLRIMASAGVIDAGLRDAALAESLAAQPASPAPAPMFTERKGVSLVRSRVSSLLGEPTLYDLDRLDLTVRSTLDGRAQDAVSRVIASLRDPATVAALGLNGFRMLEHGDPSRLIWSVTLYERGPGVNRVRVQTDSLDRPLDVNAGARLDLGSTAKLRTLISYLEAVAGLHQRYGGLPPAELRGTTLHPRDRLGAWAVGYLAATDKRDLTVMLEAALERRYPASPAAFFTGAGLQSFSNFDREEDPRIYTVREGFRGSVNLVFIRLMRDLVDHHIFRAPGSIGRVLEDPTDGRREGYLTRFADREGSEFIRRFYRKYAGKPPDEALELALGGTRHTPAGLAAVLRSVSPDADVAVLRALLATRLPGVFVADRVVEEVHARAGRLSLVDRGYVARVHPLELWLLTYLKTHPTAELSEVLKASAEARQAVYGWLFKTRHRYAQDKRIASLLELEAFLEIHRGWQRLGYPFASLTPSLGTAIGSSGDRPAALAELMGIIANGGVRQPTVLVERLQFAPDTPYETRLGQTPAPSRPVMAPEVAAVVQRALTEVVEQGTARGLRDSLRREDGSRHVVAGKTGTGDHRYETYAPGGRLIDSRPVSRAATFVFIIDGRFFGTVTAYVPGVEAGRYEFTSALPVRLLGQLMPALSSLTGVPAPAAIQSAASPPGQPPAPAHTPSQVSPPSRIAPPAKPVPPPSPRSPRSAQES
jgi:membrane peptidoglycan carboxypeptidase